MPRSTTPTCRLWRCAQDRDRLSRPGRPVPRHALQLKLDDAFRSAVSAVLGIGTAPGITNIQARYAAEQMDMVESIKIYDGSRTPEKNRDRFTYAVPTILDELTLEPVVFRNGEFLACQPLSEFEDYCFTRRAGPAPRAPFVAFRGSDITPHLQVERRKRSFSKSTIGAWLRKR